MTARADAPKGFGEADRDRRIANLLRVGKVAELDEANARVRIQAGEFLTTWVPWVTLRAGEDRMWWAPEVGEQVVLMSPSGDMSQAVVLPGIYQDSYAAPANLKSKHRVQYKDGAFTEYDRDAKKYELNVPAAGSIKLVVGGSTIEILNNEIKITTNALTVTAPNTTFSGNVDAAGEVEAGPTGIKLTTHKHTGVQSGPSQTGGPVP